MRPRAKALVISRSQANPTLRHSIFVNAKNSYALLLNKMKFPASHSVTQLTIDAVVRRSLRQLKTVSDKQSTARNNDISTSLQLLVVLKSDKIQWESLTCWQKSGSNSWIETRLPASKLLYTAIFLQGASVAAGNRTEFLWDISWKLEDFLQRLDS